MKRTVFGYARAGMGGIMIEDQVSPKRCGHVAGKSVVPFAEAVQRVKAACDARYEMIKCLFSDVIDMTNEVLIYVDEKSKHGKKNAKL